MKFSSSNDSFCVVDDDLSVKSVGNCLLKLCVHDENVFSHFRLIHLYQIADKDNNGRLSYKLLLKLIGKSLDPPDLTTELPISITYQDQHGEEILIGSSEELQYAVKTEGGDDVLNIKVKVARTAEPDQSIRNQEDSILEKISQQLLEMEGRIREDLVQVETKFMEKLDTIEQKLATTERMIEPTSTIIRGDDVIGSPVRVPSDSRNLSEVRSKSPFVVEPTTAVEPANIATAECHWVTTANEDGGTSDSTEKIADPNTWGTAQSPDKMAVKSTSDVNDGDESVEKTSGSTEAVADAEQVLSKVLCEETILLLNKCLQRMAYYDEKRDKGITQLKEDMAAQSSQFEEWNKTVLDGLAVQSKVLKARMNDRADKVVRRLSSLEAFCRDLSCKKSLNRQTRTIQKIEEEQASLRNDIKVLLRAMVKASNRRGEDDDVSVQSCTSKASSSDQESIYTTVTVVGDDCEGETGPMTADGNDVSDPDNKVDVAGVCESRPHSPTDSLILYGIDGTGEEAVWKGRLQNTSTKKAV